MEIKPFSVPVGWAGPQRPGVLPYYPLANGLLAGKVRRGRAVPPGARLAGRPEYVTLDKLDRVEGLISWAAGPSFVLKADQPPPATAVRYSALTARPNRGE